MEALPTAYAAINKAHGPRTAAMAMEDAGDALGAAVQGVAAEMAAEYGLNLGAAQMAASVDGPQRRTGAHL